MQKEKRYDEAVTRYKEPDNLFTKIYEDNVNGKLTDSRFKMLSNKYDEEQKELRAEIEILQKNFPIRKTSRIPRIYF